MTPLRVAYCVLALGLLAAWQVTVIPESPIQMPVGPVLTPGVVAGLLLLLGLLYGVSAWRGRQTDAIDGDDGQPLAGANRRMLTLLLGGVAFIALVVPLGFVIPATLCGMGVAKAFDAPFGLRSAAMCGAIALVFWTLFAQVLGVGLGPAVAWAF
ncbi:tripartite tricarboxylate transporter TctB family protein [Rhodoferax sp.]|jgi:hypothetical protein|uniref:tripartite tricarboxylate transporter TctB family protein n=1 Tax=Rhodoferax sp. TaxID=50421 RepID=UPI003783E351